MAEKMLTPGPQLMLKVRQAFLDYGYSGLSMVTLARACGFTRRSLYNYFNSKEDAFKTLIAFDNAGFIRNGMKAGEEARRKGGSALDIFTEIMDVRYGFTRRVLNLSPHIVELNAEAFKLCRDSMIQSAIDFQDELEKLLSDMQRAGMLRLTGTFSAKQVAQTLADGGRAVNQSLPPPSSDDLTRRYRQMCEAVLFGCAVPGAAAAVSSNRQFPANSR